MVLNTIITLAVFSVQCISLNCSVYTLQRMQYIEVYTLDVTVKNKEFTPQYSQYNIGNLCSLRMCELSLYITHAPQYTVHTCPIL